MTLKIVQSDAAYAGGRLWSRSSENLKKLHTVEHSGSDTAMNSQRTPPRHLKRRHIWSALTWATFPCMDTIFTGNWELSKRTDTELTNGFGNRHDLSAVERQVAKRPDDGMNLLHDVEGKGYDAASVLTNSHTPGERTKSHGLNFGYKLAELKSQLLFRTQTNTDGLTQAMSGWAQTEWATWARSNRGGTSCQWCLAASRPARGHQWCNWVGSWT